VAQVAACSSNGVVDEHIETAVVRDNLVAQTANRRLCGQVELGGLSAHPVLAKFPDEAFTLLRVPGRYGHMSTCFGESANNMYTANARAAGYERNLAVQPE
jgi:hypothetical protein